MIKEVTKDITYVGCDDKTLDLFESQYIIPNGIAYNAYVFTKKADKICISGGFCENKCFIDSLSQYSKVVPLGRFILVDGLTYLEN